MGGETTGDMAWAVTPWSWTLPVSKTKMEICFLCILASKKILIFFFFKVGTLCKMSIKTWPRPNFSLDHWLIMSNSKWWPTFSVQIFDFFILFSFRFYASSQVFGKIMHLMTGWQSWVQDLPVVEAVFVGSGLTDGFTGNRGGVGGLACSRRLPHTYIYTNTEENIHIHS